MNRNNNGQSPRLVAFLKKRRQGIRVSLLALLAVFLVGLGIYGVRATTTNGTTLRIKSVDSANASVTLPGATFRVTNTSGGEWTATTDQAGVASVPGLTQGDYTIVQINAPGGYTSNPSPQTITIGPPTGNPPTYSQYHDVTFSSAKSGRTDTTLRLKVLDIENQTKRVAGAVFNVKSSNGSTWTITSDSNGYAEVKNVTSGTYTITQISSPDGYSPMPASKVFDIPNPAPNRYPEYADVTVFNSPYDIASKGVLYINAQDSVNANIKLANVTMKVIDDQGNTYIGVTDSRGQLAIKGLSVERTYSVEVQELPSEYDFPATGVGNIRLNQANQSNTATIFIPKTPTASVILHSYEMGDSSIKVAGSRFRITLEDGRTREVTTGADGTIRLDLPVSRKYKIVQLSSDNAHTPSGEEVELYLERDFTVDFANPLKNKASATVSVSFTKEWVDKPSSVQTAQFYLYRNGQRTGNPVSIRSDAANKSDTFANLPKYDDNHQVINWTVKEEAIADWYATYEETTTNNWAIKNYEGALSGACYADGRPFVFVSSENAAYMLKNGTEIVRTVHFPGTRSDGKPGDFGHGIAYSRTNGYLYGVAATGEVAIMNPNLGANGGLIKRIRLGGIMEKAPQNRHDFNGTQKYIHPNFRKVNSMEMSVDGKYLFVKVLGDPNIYMYDVAEIEKDSTANLATVQPKQIIPALHQADTSKWNLNQWTPVSDGDFILYENGDILYTGHETRFFDVDFSAPRRDPLNYYFYIMRYTGPKNADGTPDFARGTWAKPAKAGRFRSPALANFRPDDNKADFEYAVDGLVRVFAGGEYRIFLTSEVWSGNNRTLQVAALVNNSNGRTAVPTTANPEVAYEPSFFAASELNKTTYINRLPINSLDDMTGGANEVCTPEVVVRGRKNWIGDSESDRPASIEVELYADGAPTGKRATLNTANNWSYNFSKLAKNNSRNQRIVYTVRELNVPAGYLETSDSNSYDIINTLLKGEFAIKKTTEDGRTPLAGASFNLWTVTAGGQKERLIASGTSVTGTGLVNFTGLTAGTYLLEESSAPDGYTATTTTYTVIGTVNQTTKVVDFVVKNGNTTLNRDGQAYVVTNTQPSYKFKIVKVDGVTGQTITTTSRFAITDENGNVINRQVANLTNGEFTFLGFKPGTYYLKEETAPASYIGLNGLIGFTLSADGKVTFKDGETIGLLAAYDIDRRGGDTITFRVRNFKPKLRVLKVDATNATSVLPGAKFKLFQSNGTTQIGTELTANSQGFIEFEGVTPGTYYLQESQAPEGFQTNDKRYKIIVDSDYQVTTDNGDDLLEIGATYGTTPVMNLVVKNTPKPKVARFALSKRIKGIENTGTHGLTLPVTFSLTKFNDDSFKPIVKTQPFNQTFTFENLSPGLYQIEETKAPTGYVKVPETYLVSVEPDTTVKILKDTTTPAAKIMTASVIKSDNLNTIYSGTETDTLDDDLATAVWYNMTATTGIPEGTYIGLDLGQVTKVTHINFIQGHPRAIRDRMNNAMMEYSVDGVTYTTLQEFTTTNDLTVSLGDNPILARYVRIRSTATHRGWMAMRTMRVDGRPVEVVQTLTPEQQVGTANLFLYGNIQNPSINLQKVDLSGRVIARPSEFKLYKVADNLSSVSMADIAEDKLIQTFTLGNGQTTVNLSASVLGKYALVETKAPTGYTGLTEPILLNLIEAEQPHDATQNKAVTRFEVLSQPDAVVIDTSATNRNNTIVVKVKNPPSGYNLKILKRDYNDTAVGLNAGFALYDETGQTEIPGRRGDTTQAGNSLTFANLPLGTYVLKEIRVPQDYRKLKDIKFTVKADGSIEILSDNAAYTSVKPAGNTITIELTVKNRKNGEYPKTGGLGTIIWYLTGLGLMGLAVYYSKRKEAS